MAIKITQLNRLALAGFFIIAGLNHFVLPHFYYPLIPEYLPFPVTINYASGVIEVALGVGLLFAQIRKLAAWGIIILMVLFIPSHVYFIQIGSCVEDGLCVPEWVAWVRLVLIHPGIMYWAWRVKR